MDITREFRSVLEELFKKNTENIEKLESIKQKVFISYSFGLERAKVVKGVGNTLQTAFESARNTAIKQIKNKTMLPKWILLDVVTREKTITVAEYYKLLTNTRRGFFRLGVAFDELYNTAFLEQEIYASSLIKYEKQKDQSFHMSNINHYIKKNKGIELQEVEPSDEIILFDTDAYFYDSGMYHKLYSNNAGLLKGIRDLKFVGTKDNFKKYIVNYIRKSSDYLLSTLSATGELVYGYFPCFDKKVPLYNIVRHALAVYSFADVYFITKDEKYKKAANISLDYMFDNYLYHYDNEIAFIHDYVNEAGEAEIKLGALAVAILSTVKCLDFLEERDKYINILRKIGNGILYLQDKEKGNFTHVLNYPQIDVKENFRIIYYDGEACFALMSLYALDKDDKWLNAVEKAFDYFIENDYHKYYDHWLAYAANHLTAYIDNDKYFEFGLKNAFYNIDFIINRETAWHTFLEMLNASYLMIQNIKDSGKDYLLQGYDVDKLNYALDVRFQRQLTSIMFPEIAMFFKSPQKVLNGIFIRHHTFRIRNDDVAHHLMGYCNYLRIKFPS